MPRKGPVIKERYEVRDAGYKTPCWIWLLGKSPDGYGKVKVQGRTHRAHRWYYHQEYGTMPEILDHLCRNILCVNPAHLEPVTNTENIRRGRSAKLSDADVAYIRDVLRDEVGIRTRSGKSQELCRQFGISAAQMSRIKNGIRWPA